ncbi:glycosyltransferase [Rudanella paleaurantiibacter]|uniref:Glycosyltransferase n=1 Tax=Rudanella paleaurantiibacter TaxID=2614655 RepID=A0A7J5TXI5_9BACT|nr:glycosyltransferase family 1 protein [Rudanella paleaurantiibacter]KAB7729362.1 glycosyltransferase [Rudanella paleaurantiibacter]
MNKQIVINARFLTQRITGTQRFAIELSIRLKKLMPDLIFVSPKNILHQDLARQLEVKTIGNFKNGILWEQIELPLYLKSHGTPLLLNLCNTGPLYYTRKVVSIMDISFHLHPEWFSKSFSAYYNFLIPRLVQESIGVITISKASSDDLVEYFNVDPQKIQIIYPGVSKIFDKNVEVSNLNNSNYLLAVSSMDPRKNFIGLINAFMNSPLDNVKLLIVGNTNSLFAASGIEKLAAKKDNVEFTGYVGDRELVKLYQNALAFVYPSFFEGFGIPPLEAMACGCPTIVANTTSLPEVCGDASAYVNPYRVDDIEKVITEVVTNESLRQSLVKKGFERVAKFNWDHSAEKLVSYLYDVAKK